MAADTPPPPPPSTDGGPALPALRAPGGPWRAMAALLQPVLVMGLLLVLVGGAAVGALLWLLRSPEGTVWLAARLPGIEVQGPRGALLSDHFEADRVVVRWDGGRQWVAVDGFVGTGLRWSWHPSAGAWAGLSADRLTARRVEVQTGPPGPRPIVMPRSMQVPLRLHAAQAQVDELQIDRLPPMRRLQATGVRLWEPGGREYHAERLQMDWERARIDGQASLGALPPYTLQAELRAQALDEPPAWTARLRARGPLAGFELDATLQGRAAPGAPAPALQLRAEVRALQAFPLGALQLATQSLDLSALSARAPRTSLSGRAEIEARSFDGPVAASVLLTNAHPGRWDQGRVPARRLQARLRSPDADRARLQVESFEVDFAQGGTEAGRWQGRADWAGAQLRVSSRIDGLRPQLLDARASAMSLSGPLEFTLDGLPSPDPRAAAPARPPPLTVTVQTTLDGQVERSPLPVQLAIDATADARHIVVRELKAHAGSATVTLAADVKRADGGSWQVRSSGALSEFDPVPWWPGAEGSAWRAGPHRLSGSWSIDLAAPRPQPGQPLLAWVQTLAGSGTLVVQRSQLAGVPVSGQFELGYRTGAGPMPGHIGGELRLGANRLTVEGRGDPLGDGARDRIQVQLDAPALAALAPLARLLPDTASWQPRGGSATGRVTFDGRWPTLRTEGQADLQRLQVGALEVQRAQARWRLDSAADQPLLLELQTEALSHGSQQLERLSAELRGTLAQHRIDIALALAGQPPRWLERTFGLRTARGMQGQLRGEGRWSADGTGGGRWSGQVAELLLGPWAGAGAAVPTGPGSQWVRATELRTELRFDARRGLVEWLSAAGQLRLADALTLRWNEVRVDLSGPAPTFALHADIDPFELAPLLARGQPEMGWGGDLRLGARIDLRVAEQVDADFLFDRRSGDLHLTEEHATLPFGLNELRVVASAHDGHWQLAGAFAGRTLGEAAARLNLRHPPGQRWPDANTPIDGVIEAHVANLGIWGSWVPPGWRLSGRVDTQAQVTGRLGAPDYAGEVRASDVAVRNLLLGVDLQQGEARVRLAGARAEIERFSIKGGEGRLDVTGHATLDDKPLATLALKAERFRLLGRLDRQLIASADVQLQIGADEMRAQGKVKVDEGLFDLGRQDAPSLDDDVTIRQAQVDEDAAAGKAPPPARARRTQRVAIDLDLGERLRLRGRGLDTTLTGQLKVGAAAGRLALNGIINAAGGTYAAYGQKLEIERGLVVFTGAPDNPTLDVLALRPDIDVQVGVAITGALDAPRVRLYANGDMSESDKLSWLVLGRPSDGLGRADTALLQRAAVALLAGEGEAPTDALLRNLGLDQLSVRQSDGDVRETVVSLGKQLSRRWYVGYERGVNATTGTWQLIYRIAQRFTLRAQSGLENSLDLIWVWRLEEDPLLRAPAAAATKAPVPKSAASAPP